MLKHIHTGPVTTGQNRSIRGTSGGAGGGGGGGLGRPIPPLNVSTSSAATGNGGTGTMTSAAASAATAAAGSGSGQAVPPPSSASATTKHMNGGPPGRLLSSSYLTPLASSIGSTNGQLGGNGTILHGGNTSAISGLTTVTSLGNGILPGAAGGGGAGGGGGPGPGGLFSHLNSTTNNNILSSTINMNKARMGAREALTSLGLLCLVSLLLALLSLIFLLKISPGGREPPPPTVGPAVLEDYAIVYDVTLALCALSLSLNLCCLLVCAIQFLFAVKLVRAPATTGRGNKYLQKSSVSRVCAVGGFFISIPIFLTGIILYTFTQFHSTPAIVTSILIGVGIVFCGGAMVHNVFVWQREKTISVRQTPLNLNLTLSPQISTISNGVGLGAGASGAGGGIPQYHQYQHQNGHGPSSGSASGHHPHHHPLSLLNHVYSNHNNTPLTHNSQASHTTPITQLTPVTPLSANHSHISFNHSYVPPPYGVRAATATPPTPKVIGSLLNRDASGSVSPGMPGSGGNNNNLDMSNVTTANSPHELSTLV
uniref:Putative glycine-rich cell wall structural protein 1 n=1 Tax=Anopheles darlingi TaxID=43151 RepID=A0A2M4CRK8_ANODA